MGAIISKTDQVRELVSKGQFKQALKIAKTFRLGLSKQQRDTIVRAYEAHHYGDMMRQMKRDPEQAIQAGVSLLQELYA